MRFDFSRPTYNQCARHLDYRHVVTITILLCMLFLPTFVAHLQAEPTQKPANDLKSPLSAEESLKHFRLHPALSIEIVASEPQVIDPVAVRFDESGRMWVVEMSDYPNGPAEGEEPKSRIRILEDRDQDGRYETSTVFADKLLFATGLQPWKGGVIVTMAGRVAFLRDDDGDNRADSEETWFTGFAERNPQLRANHPSFALDNHIYVANGLRGGDVIARRKEWSEGAKPAAISGMDFRFDPHTGVYEAVSGVGQFGMTFDDFGNRFVCSNRNPSIHIVLEDRYVKRNPFLSISSVRHDVSPAGEQSRVFPISRSWTTSTLHAGQITAACGVTIYRGDLLPDEFHGNSFTCEPTGNLVHRDVLAPDGATFKSKPGREGIEFLATKDEWFRPANQVVGPDGALYIVDIYRAVIEHPQWVPDELKNRPDNYYGNDRGRIYRIVPKRPVNPEQPKQTTAPTKRGSRTGTRHPRTLSGLSTGELAALLGHPNSWQREMAARLLNERQDKSAASSLERIIQSGKTPQARALALWALEGIDELRDKHLLAALNDPHLRVVEQAVRLAESRLADHPRLGAQLVDLHPGTNDARLAFQIALSLGQIAPNAKTRARLSRIAVGFAHDPWVRRAVATSVGEDASGFFEDVLTKVVKQKSGSRRGIDQLVAETATLVGSRLKAEEIVNSLETLGQGLNDAVDDSDTLRIRFIALENLATGISRRGKALSTYVEQLSPEPNARIKTLFDVAVRSAGDGKLDVRSRHSALRLLKYAGFDTTGDALLALARDEQDRSIRLAAIGTLAAFEAPTIADTILEDYPAQTPAIRRAVLDVLLASTSRTKRLLDEIAAKHIAVSELDPSRVKQLVEHKNADIKKRAKELLASAVPADRKQVLTDYQAALKLKSDAGRGREVFKKNCTACHRIGGMGVNVAPDIGDSRVRTPASLLTDILDPNRAIDSNYFSYTVMTTDGKVHTGVISSETASSITLRQQENKTVELLRQDIDEMRSNGVSLMPVGLEKNVTVEQMADLISFIKNWRYLDGRVPIKIGE